MLNWLIDNLPIISAILVAIAPFLAMMQQRTTGIKKMKEYAEILSLLDKNSSSRGDIEALLKQQSEKALERSKRKIDGYAIFVTVFFAGALGTASYFLVSWAMRYDGVLEVFLWILFVLVVLLAILVVATGSKLIYKEKKQK